MIAACSGDRATDRSPSLSSSGAGAAAADVAGAASGPIPGAPPPMQLPNAGAMAQPPPATITGFEEPPPEKTGVVFDWPETDPAKASNCLPGHYVGEYECRLHIITDEGDGAFDLIGTIDMTLERTASGELLRIANGKFASATAAVIPLFADVVGELNCSTSRFEGRLENGTFSVALGLPVPFTEGTFAGDLSSDYEPASAALTGGVWSMAGELDLFPGSCMGMWSARRVD